MLRQRAAKARKIRNLLVFFQFDTPWIAVLVPVPGCFHFKNKIC